MVCDWIVATAPAVSDVFVWAVIYLGNSKKGTTLLAGRGTSKLGVKNWTFSTAVVQTWLADADWLNWIGAVEAIVGLDVLVPIEKRLLAVLMLPIVLITRDRAFPDLKFITIWMLLMPNLGNTAGFPVFTPLEAVGVDYTFCGH
jgi:hypothetical protein